ncbi:MAG TPA: hypothetical protein PK859_06780 [Spirochaetota bacterium]|nr:hypothetical protein [Spirochaetota bacterium]HPR47483.1 hypothetical protein [Spirochaetota bacterium]
MKTNDTSTPLLFYSDIPEKARGPYFVKRKKRVPVTQSNHKYENFTAALMNTFRGTIVEERIASFQLEL